LDEDVDALWVFVDVTVLDDVVDPVVVCVG